MSDSDIFITKKPNSEILRKQFSEPYLFQNIDENNRKKYVF
jgi:hypothetical protein